MASILLSLPVLSTIAILQSAVVSRIPLNQGSADLMMVILIAYALQRPVKTAWQWSIIGGLLVDFFSGLPFGVFLIPYLAVTGFALLLRERVWRFSFLMMVLIVVTGTLLSHLTAVVVLFFQGATLDFNQVFQAVTLPSLILNTMLSLPVYLVTRDIVLQFNPQEEL